MYTRHTSAWYLNAQVSQTQTFFKPTALRKAKIIFNFGLSESNTHTHTSTIISFLTEQLDISRNSLHEFKNRNQRAIQNIL